MSCSAAATSIGAASASEAARQPVAYGPLEAKPEQLLSGSRPHGRPPDKAPDKAPDRCRTERRRPAAMIAPTSTRPGPCRPSSKSWNWCARFRARVGDGAIRSGRSVRPPGTTVARAGRRLALNDDRPGLVLLDIRQARLRRAGRRQPRLCRDQAPAKCRPAGGQPRRVRFGQRSHAQSECVREVGGALRTGAPAGANGQLDFAEPIPAPRRRRSCRPPVANRASRKA